MLSPKLWIPIFILLGGLAGASLLWLSRPAVAPEAPEAFAPLVEVVVVTPEEVRFVVRTQGTVEPRTESELIPQVSGKVVWLSPALASGGAFEAGEPLLRIEATDYEIELESTRATLARTRSQHGLAKKEFARQRRMAEQDVTSQQRIDDAESSARVASAALRESQARLARAERDLERTEMKAPFAGRVRVERVDVGQFVSRGQGVATLYAVDQAQVRLPIPDRELAFLDLPLSRVAAGSEFVGPEVTLHAEFAGSRRTWTGRVVRTEGEIDARSRMVHVVAEVEDPYGRKSNDSTTPLAVGLFVEAEILGRSVPEAVVLPRGALRDGNQVAVVDADSRLRFRTIEVLRTEGDRVVIGSGLTAGERVCVSPLPGAVDGMAVRVAESEAELREYRAVNRAIAWFAENGVAANLLMALLVVGGIAALPRIQQKSFPDIEVDVIQIAVPYPGAAPSEVEEGVCVRIEEEIQDVEGIERIRSTAAEGACGVSAELLQGASIDRALADIKNSVDGISTFPEEAEEPVVNHLKLKRNAVQVALWGDTSEKTLKVWGERLRDGLSARPGITQVELAGVRDYEISIEISEESLRRHGLTFSQVADAVRRTSLDLPGGSIKTRVGEVLLRTKGQAYRGPEFEELVVLTRPDGTRLRLGEVATVVDGFKDDDQYARFNGKPAVLLQVFRVGDQKVLDLVAEVKDYAATTALPDGLHLTVWRNNAQVLRDRLSILFENGRMGFVLVLMVLALFLRLRLAIWVALGVPISFLGALLLFPVLDISIDVISAFAFILVLGLLVDDAIVVGENIHTHQERDEEPLPAAIRGAQEVAVPVIFGVLTSVAAFLPMLISPGPYGQVFRAIALVVVCCLILSLVESQLVLPAHLGHHGGSRTPRPTRPGSVRARWAGIQARMAGSLQNLARRRYEPALGRALEWRYATFAGGIALLMLAVTVVASGWMRFSFFPPVEGDYVTARLSMPVGTPVETTAAAVQMLEASALVLQSELDEEYTDASVVKHLLASVGSQPSIGAGGGPPASSGSGSHLGEVSIELLGGDARPLPAPEVAKRWRALVPPIPGIEDLVFSSDLFSGGDPVDIQLQAPDVVALEAAAEKLKARLAEYPGVFDVADSFRGGKRELKLDILPGAEPLGLTLSDLARQVRQAFYGEEAQRIQRGRDDVRVMVRYPESGRRSLADLDDLRIRTPDGGEVPFYTVARAEMGRGFATIRRSDRQRVINVTADIDLTRANANEVLASIERGFMPGLLADYPELSYSLRGEQREQQKTFASLRANYVYALLVIYALLAVPLRSYLQPFIIMAVIPFGLVGAIGGHLLMSPFVQAVERLSMMSIFGVVALSGVVVNSSLVLVHYVNQRREEGATIVEAIHAAGLARFRPIVLTSLTTFAGLTPLLMERSVSAQFLIPMATSLAFGVAFATLISLFLVPAFYLILEDVKRLVGRGEATPASLEAVPSSVQPPRRLGHG